MARLNDQPVKRINADLTALGDEHSRLDISTAVKLGENAKTAFQGITKGGSFDIPGELARTWIKHPNPNSRSSSAVLRPWQNGLDVTRRNGDNWIIDFSEIDEDDAMLFEQPFTHVLLHVKPERDKVSRERRRRIYWQYNECAPGMRKAIAALERFIVTPEVAKHRVFTWLQANTVPDKNLIVFARTDDTCFGILHSRFHELWSLLLGTSLEDRPRYTNSTTFETFPFPTGLTPADTRGQPQAEGELQLPPVAADYLPAAYAIASAAQRLNALRENWLNPVEWVERVPEVVAGYPERIIAKPEHAAELKKRTLTNLYNARPAWLANAHNSLDLAVAQAYGWNDYSPEMPDEEILRRLLALNQQRSG